MLFISKNIVEKSDMKTICVNMKKQNEFIFENLLNTAKQHLHVIILHKDELAGKLLIYKQIYE